LTTARKGAARAPRRSTTWIEENADTIVATGALHGETLVNVPGNFSLVRSTITRILLTVVFEASAAEVAGDALRLDFGIAILSSDAVAASALPDPSTSTPDSGMWLLRDMAELVLIATVRDPRSTMRMTYDLKGQRILRQDNVVQLILKNTDISGAADMALRVMSRVLVKLP